MADLGYGDIGSEYDGSGYGEGRRDTEGAYTYANTDLNSSSAPAHGESHIHQASSSNRKGDEWQSRYYESDEQQLADLSARSDRVGQLGAWVQMVEQETGNVYYYNEETGEYSWSEPNMSAEEVTLLTARSEIVDESDAQFHDPSSPWQEVRDPESDTVYYWRPDTNETSWTKPPATLMDHTNPEPVVNKADEVVVR